MSYSEDNVISKLSTLNETQETVTGVSQWIMFHKRQAHQSARIWAEYIGNVPASKKLSLIYLANEIAQQSRAKKKDEFVKAFQQVIPSALGNAYHACPEIVKTRIKRVVDVWKQRNIFSPDAIDEIEKKMKSGHENSSYINNRTTDVFRSDTDPELNLLMSLHERLNDTAINQQAETAFKAYDSLFNADVLPAPAIYAAKLANIDKSLKEALENIASTESNRNRYDQILKNLLSQSEKNGEKVSALIAELEMKNSHVAETKEQVEELLVVGETEPSPEIEGEFDSEANADKYQPESLENSAVPAYSPLSSDEEDEQDDSPALKKPKIDITSVEGLDPAVASLLTSLTR